MGVGGSILSSTLALCVCLRTPLPRLVSFSRPSASPASNSRAPTSGFREKLAFFLLLAGLFGSGPAARREFVRCFLAAACESESERRIETSRRSAAAALKLEIGASALELLCPAASATASSSSSSSLSSSSSSSLVSSSLADCAAVSRRFFPLPLRRRFRSRLF